MRTICLIAVLSTALIGCTKEIEEHAINIEQLNSPTKTTASFTTAEAQLQWAADLLNEATHWQPVTAKAVPAHLQNFALCRLPIPGVDDHGPHNAYTPDDLYGKDRDNKPKSPSNQFIVNPIAKDRFKKVSGQDDKAAAVPPPLPVGTVIIKEKYNEIEDANKRINAKAFGVMIKHEPGYNPEHGDWEYAYIEISELNQSNALRRGELANYATLDRPNTITNAKRGKIANCIDCHANAKQKDYVFRNYLNDKVLYR